MTVSGTQAHRPLLLVVVIVFVALFVGNLQISILFPILPDLVYRMNLTHEREPLVIGTVMGSGTLVEVLLMPAVVLVLKFLGQKWTLTLSSLLESSGCFVIGTLPFLGGLYVGRILQCSGAVVMDIAACALIADYFQANRSRALASVLHAIPLSYLASNLIGTWIYHFIGSEKLFISIGVGTFLVTALWFLLPSLREDCQPLCLEKTGKDHNLPLSLAANVLIWSSMAVMDSTAPYDFFTRFHVTVWQIGIVMAASVAAQILAQICVGEKKDCYWVFTWVGLFVSGVGLVIYPFFRSFWPTVTTECFVRIGHGLVNTSNGCIVGEIADFRSDNSTGTEEYSKTHEYNWLYGWHSLSKVLGLTLGSFLGGIVVQYLNIQILYWSYGGILAVLGISLGVWSKWRNYD